MQIEPPRAPTVSPRPRFDVLPPDMAQATAAPKTRALDTSFEGVDFVSNAVLNGGYAFVPPDPTVAAGPAHLVNVVNTSIEWRTKVGTDPHAESLPLFFASLDPVGPPDGSLYDPRVVYDQTAERFVVILLELVSGADPAPAISPENVSRILVAVSDDADPNGPWYFAAIDAKEVVGGHEAYADYPGLAVDGDVVYVTSNLWTFDTTTFVGSRLWIVQKDPLYDGGAADVAVFDPPGLTGVPATTAQPAHMFGPEPGTLGTFLVRYSGASAAGQEYLSIFRVDDAATVPTFTHQYVLLGDIDDTAIDPLPGAPQADTAELIATNGREVFNAVWRDGSLYVGTHVMPSSGTDAGQVTAHWARVNTTQLANLTVADQGNVSGEDIAPGTFTFFPAVGVDAQGNMAIGFSASGPDIHPGAYYASRVATAPLGTLEPARTLRAGLDFYNRKLGDPANRWGDYSGLAIDPGDGLTFWVYNEYAIERGNESAPGEDGRWGTALGSFQATTSDVTVVSLVGDQDGIHPGDPADVSPKSDLVISALRRIEEDPGQDAPVDLDVGGSNRPVGLTHYFAIPSDARISSAHLRVRVQGTDALFFNDLIELDIPEFPLITFYDVLGFEPVTGATYVLDIDLGRVPVRTGGDVGPGGDWATADPQFLEYRDLRPGLLDGSLDLIFGDDHIVDWSELTITYARAPNTPVGASVTVSPLAGIDVTFAEVTEAGTTTAATGITPALPLPPYYQLGSTGTEAKPISVYDVESSATYEGAVIVSIAYDPALFERPGNVRVLHREGDQYVDRTLSNDTTTHVVTALLPSLSELVLAELTGELMARSQVHKALLRFGKPGHDAFDVVQSFALSEDTDGIDPANESVRLGVGFYEEVIEAGSFRAISWYGGFYASHGTRIWTLLRPHAHGVRAAAIVLFADGRGFVAYDGQGVDLSTTRELDASSVPFSLQIGDDLGEDVVCLAAKGHVWFGPK